MSKKKYLKYKLKYLNLKKKHGGSQNDSIIDYGTDSDESINNTYELKYNTYEPKDNTYEPKQGVYDASSQNNIIYNMEDSSRDQSDTNEIISNNKLAFAFAVMLASIIGTSSSISSIIP